MGPDQCNNGPNLLTMVQINVTTGPSYFNNGSKPNSFKTTAAETNKAEDRPN